jgi:small subunit ribosomal protein S7
MSRRRRAIKRKSVADPIFKSMLVTKFISTVMIMGKKSTAQNIIYTAFEDLERREKGKNAIEILEKALENSRPILEVKSRRVGGATYQVPIEVPIDRGNSLAIRWMIQFAKGRKGGTMSTRLASEIYDAYNNQGNAVKKRENVHKMAEANKAFAHYRW